MVLAAEKSNVMTVEEFDRYALLPENRDRRLEFIAGRMVEVVSNGVSSSVGAFVGSFIGVFVKTNDLGFVTGADGGYRVSGERYIPDFAYVSKQRQAKPSKDGYNLIVPDLAVEVLSPGNTEEEIRVKIVNYLNAETTVWVFDALADIPHVEIYAPGQKPVVLTAKETLDGGTVLPGFTLPLSLNFGEEANEPDEPTQS